ncbi:hypothetical protein DFH28DRAFT_1123910 [Melampsora americana]|nr:hypothetical protein DFH28DRAFT_1123910 [Melampsora americana]
MTSTDQELAAGTSHPISFKSLALIDKTIGIMDLHVILRGGKVPNHQQEYVKEATVELLKSRPSWHPAIMISCSDGF